MRQLSIPHGGRGQGRAAAMSCTLQRQQQQLIIIIITATENCNNGKTIEKAAKKNIARIPSIHSNCDEHIKQETEQKPRVLSVTKREYPNGVTELEGEGVVGRERELLYI